MGRKSSREDILDALERVLNRQGLGATTMEAVAAEAGVSKGGIFYHFASKMDMLLSLMDRYERNFEIMRGQIAAELPDGPTRLLKATLLASLGHPARRSAKLSNLVTLLDDAELRARIRQSKKKVLDELTRDSISPEKVAMSLLIVDGLWISELLDKPVYSEKFKQSIISELMKVIDTLAEGDGGRRPKGRKSNAQDRQK